MAGVQLVDEMIEMRVNTDFIIIKFGNCFRKFLEQSSLNSNPVFLAAISKTLGHLVKAGGQVVFVLDTINGFPSFTHILFLFSIRGT